MTYGLGRDRRRQRQRRRATAAKWLLALIVILATGYYSYYTGSELARQEVVKLQSELKNLQQTNAMLERKNSDLQAASHALHRRHAELKERFDEKVPTGQRLAMLEQIDRRLQAGVTAERLTSVVEAVENERRCEGEPVSKRFLVRTSLYEGANDSVGFADSTITVTAEGQYALDKNQNAETWFDPAKPVTLRFAHLGGTTKVAAGILPVHASIVIDDIDYRFTAVAGERNGFVSITGQGCRYP